MALVVGNSLKAGVRFVSYDHFKQMLADPQVRVFFLGNFEFGFQV
jgi:solute carrier family 25 citrate transporter 1